MPTHPDAMRRKN